MATDQEKLSFYLPANEAEWVRQFCEEEGGRSLSSYIRLLIRRDRAVRERIAETDGAAA